MNRESRKCQNCQQEFWIEPDDFAFYEKVDVPSPTWCPECRAVRRMTWRNEMNLYKRKCVATKKDVISMFVPEIPVAVYERNYWWSDKWDQFATGKNYDFSKPFFAQFRERLESAPLPNLANNNMVNSDYANHSHGCKNCYLIFASADNENVNYANGAAFCKDSLDLYAVGSVEQSYEDVLCIGLNKVFFSYGTDESLDSAFLRACKNVNSCLGCVNLRNKSYHVFNKPYSKEGYEKELKRIDLGSYKNLIEFQKKFLDFSLKYPRRHSAIIKSVNSTGDNIVNSKNCKVCFDIYGSIEDSKFVAHAYELKDSYDGYGFGGNASLLYEGIDTGIDGDRCRFTVFTHGCHDVHYTYSCHSSSNLFGCIGLKKAKYCILNKQYSKEEYEKLVPKIIEHMNEMPYTDKKGREYKYGEFFPSELSPFAYNDSVAQQYFQLSKEEILKQGYLWRDTETRRYEITIEPSNLPDHIKDTDSSIIKEVIRCEHNQTCNEQCTQAFKIIPDEFQFLRKMNLPLPRLCPNCRHYQRLKQRNPLKLWHRKCTCGGGESDNNIYKNTVQHFHNEDHCPNEFKTSYAPERGEIVYCEECYNAEVV